MTEQAAAAAALKGIARIEAGARQRSRRLTGCLWAFAGWQLVLVPTVVLWHGRTGTLVSTVANAVVVMALSAFATRQPAVPRGHGRRYLGAIGAWAAAYVLSLALGLTLFADSTAFAAAAALLCALPPAAAAWREVRAA
ncbi:hypothetical protein [Streptomyces sp. NPDC047976]|uniref:hypothetical protein n=1 Tax=unclassified Streptomyces TaxID=2593676 RepID=UPI0034224307